jgi:hypothetical protein
MTDVPRLERPDGLSLALNYLPVLQLAGGFTLAFGACSTPFARLVCLAAWIYLLPPVVARLTLMVFGRPAGRATLDSRDYRVWWFLTQWQMVFNRMPWLEEMLRLVPGSYPLWIGLWGGRLSLFAYVSPGVSITDRYLVDVGRGAVLGMKCTLAGHIAVRDESGRFVVLIGAPRVEDQAVVGGEAGLGPGATLLAGQMLPVGRRVAAFAVWPRSGPAP